MGGSQVSLPGDRGEPGGEIPAAFRWSWEHKNSWVARRAVTSPRAPRPAPQAPGAEGRGRPSAVLTAFPFWLTFFSKSMSLQTSKHSSCVLFCDCERWF